ncbi:hypothetical protein EDD21DRAFT_408760 [Dissophora ornata]|nr:hypothetical protein EDD21DRAFT_408760 [Dissophora ornata]
MGSLFLARSSLSFSPSLPFLNIGILLLIRCTSLPFTTLTMSTTNDMWQQIKYGDKTYEVQVYSGVKDTQGTPFVLLEDIQYYFPDVSKFMIGRRLVSFMRDQNFPPTAKHNIKPEKTLRVDPPDELFIPEFPGEDEVIRALSTPRLSASNRRICGAREEDYYPGS